MEQQPAPNINILSFKKQENSGLSKFLSWSLQYGRIIIIMTEMVVIIAFISRFYFDARLSDLHDTIQAKETLIQESQSSQEQFLSMQAKLNAVGKIIDSRKDYANLIANINAVKPADMSINELTVKDQSIQINATIDTVGSLNSFIQSLNTSDKFTDASISDLSIKDGKLALTTDATIQDKAFQ